MEPELSYYGPDAESHLSCDSKGRPRLYYHDRAGVLNSGRPFLVEFDDDTGRYIVRDRMHPNPTPDQVRCWEAEGLGLPVYIDPSPGNEGTLWTDVHDKSSEGTENG